MKNFLLYSNSMLYFHWLTSVLIGQDCLGSHDPGSGLECPPECRYPIARHSPVVHTLHLRRYSRRKVTQGQEFWTLYEPGEMTLPWRYVSIISLCCHRKEGVLNLVSTPRMPSGEKRSGEQSWISWAYSPKVVRTNKIARSVIITKHFPYNSNFFLSLLKYLVPFLSGWTLLGDTLLLELNTCYNTDSNKLTFFQYSFVLWWYFNITF